MRRIRWIAVVAGVVLSLVVGAPVAQAESPAVQRTMSCVDSAGGSLVFVGEQVRNGATPHVWRNVERVATPAAFVFHGVRMVDADGTVEVVEATNGATSGADVVECSFVIPVGPNAGKTVVFTGFFVP